MDLIRRYNELCQATREGGFDVPWSGQANVSVDVETYPDDEDECAHVVLDLEAQRARSAGVEVSS